MITSAQTKILHVARRQLALEEEDYRSILTAYGGVTSARDLDADGFTMVMHRFAELGFRSTSAKRNFGQRAGMASPRQIGLIRTLWRQWASDASDVSLDHWLEHHFKISSLRFLDVATAAKVIPALKAMTAREN
jgi:hypothetical protein